MQTHRTLFTGLLALAILMGSFDAGARGPAGPALSATGIFNVLDDTLGGSWSSAGQIAINAGLNPDGSPYGTVDIVARGDFAAAWGACPYDPRCEDFPNTSTFTFRLAGRVGAVSVVGDTVEVSGVLVETDRGKSDGIIFEAENEPYVVTAVAGSNEFVFQFCQVPPFTMNLDNGVLQIGTGAPAVPALIQKPVPAARAGRAMACQSPSTR